MKRHALQLVREFTREMLNGDVQKFRDFNFQTLRDSAKYGCPDRNFDCDDTNIMRAVYVVLWGDFLPYLTDGNFGFRKQYRGDTVNTFHTMFGREIMEKPGFFAGLEKYSPSDELREKVRHFGKLCSCIGNYVVLPNYFTRQTSLNCYRGTNDWHDFFDRFLQELYKVLTGQEGQDETLRELVNVNGFCFRKLQGENGFRDFVRNLMLEDYCDSSCLPKTVFAMNYHWKNEQDPEQYFRDAGLYLEQTEKIILRRAERMVRRLETEFAGEV